MTPYLSTATAPSSRWTGNLTDYCNRERGKPYRWHHQAELDFVSQDSPWRYGLAKGGEGGGKSVAGIVKTLERLRRGMHGILVSPDFEHFKRSLWPEFARWCPWEHVVPGQRYRARPEWEPTKPFTLVFDTGGRLICGGIEDPTGWEGPNVHFAHFDEGRRHKTPAALKVLDGRCRLVGPNGEPPQLWLTTTPAMHWLYDYYGPLVDAQGRPRSDHLHPDFARRALVVDLLTADNERAGNLAAGYTEMRRSTLTEAEARVLLEAAWEDINTAERFLPSMIWWDDCRAEVPALDRHTPIVLAADGSTDDDTFALVGAGWWQGRIVPWIVRAWEPQGQPLDYREIEAEIRDICERYSVLQIAYDRYQLHQMMTGIMQDGVAWTEPFAQTADRLVADKALQDRVRSRGIAHDGNELLRAHLDNADRKREGDDRLRIVKRAQARKIDLAVALSMACHRLAVDFPAG